MLGKLIKHDFKYLGRVLLPVNLILLGLSILGVLFAKTPLFHSGDYTAIAVLLTIGYSLSIGAAILLSILFPILCFYRNLFSAQGYLSFTLPTTPWLLLTSKLITSLCFAVLNAIVILVSGFLFILSGVGFSSISFAVKEYLSGLGVQHYTDLNGVSHTQTTVHALTGYDPVPFLFVLVLMLLIGYAFTMLTGYVSIAIGQQSNKRKVGSSIAIYIVLSIVINAVSSTVMAFTNPSPIQDITWGVGTHISSVSPLFSSTLILNLILGAVFFVVCGLIMNKRVNLE
ncbi:ABC transporter permease [Clostridia bacterium]|nr:ABC transporter permease [Clostridia bacterium]